jgi:hypothetical protein
MSPPLSPAGRPFKTSNEVNTAQSSSYPAFSLKEQSREIFDSEIAKKNLHYCKFLQTFFEETQFFANSVKHTLT